MHFCYFFMKKITKMYPLSKMLFLMHFITTFSKNSKKNTNEIWSHQENDIRLHPIKSIRQ